MGIRLLNSFINSSKSSGIREISLQELAGKKVVVDASIYMYRFKASGCLVESLFLMCSVFRAHNIHALFIFDGQPPSHKQAIVEERRRSKERAEAKRLSLLKKLEEEEEEMARAALKREIARTTKKCARLSRQDILAAKELLCSCGLGCLQALGEADEVCAAMVIQGHAYACISEDTDMFVYGCSRVIKYLSLTRHTAMLYHLDTLLNDLDLSFTRFRELCAFSGTDYYKTNHSIFDLYGYFRDYERSGDGGDIAKWLSERLGGEWPNLQNILAHYCIDDVLSPYKYRIIRNGEIDHSRLRPVLEDARFVFEPCSRPP